jgi:hypothetical protein
MNSGSDLEEVSQPDEIVLTDEQAATLHLRMDGSAKLTFDDAESAVLFLTQNRLANS